MGVKDQVMGNKNMAARSGNFGSAHAAQRLSAAANIFKNSNRMARLGDLSPIRRFTDCLDD